MTEEQHFYTVTVKELYEIFEDVKKDIQDMKLTLQETQKFVKENADMKERVVTLETKDSAKSTLNTAWMTNIFAMISLCVAVVAIVVK